MYANEESKQHFVKYVVAKKTVGRLESFNQKIKILIYASCLKNKVIKTSAIQYLRVNDSSNLCTVVNVR